MKFQLLANHDLASPGGATTFCRAVAKELHALGHEASGLCPSSLVDQPTWQEAGGLRYLAHPPVSNGRLWRLSTVGRMSRLAPVLRASDIGADAIISHSGRYAMAAKRAFPSTPVAYVVPDIESSHRPPGYDEMTVVNRCCARLNRWLTYRLERTMYQCVDAVLCPTESHRQWVTDWFGINGETWHVSPFGVYDVMPRVARSIEQVRAEQQTSPHATVAVTVSALSENKNTTMILDALRVSACETLTLWIVGDGVQRQALQRRAGELGLTDRVRFVGWVDEPAEYLAAADVFVLASKLETFGHVYLEAMTASLPVLGPKMDMPGTFSVVEEIIEPGVSGWGFDRRDPAALAERLDLLAGDSTLRRRMGAAARERALSRFTWRQHTADILSALPTRPGNGGGVR